MLADPRCEAVTSIDPRPQWQPDDRPGLEGWEYRDNSTARMIEHLETVPGADLSKLMTIESDAANVSPGSINQPDLCFIDGEHTRRAVLSDARFCRTVMGDRGVIAFHDSDIVGWGILDFLRELPRPHSAFAVRNTMFVVELGGSATLGDPTVASRVYRPRRTMLAHRLRGDTLLHAASCVRRSLGEHGARGAVAS